MPFTNFLSELKRLNLPVKQYAVFGSGPLAVRGIRDTNDLDIIVKPILWKKLSAIYSPKNSNNNNNKEVIHIGNIEVFKDWKPWFNDINSLINSADIIDNLPFVRLEYVLKWKKIRNMEKDKKDIQLIESFLTKKQINQTNITTQIKILVFGNPIIKKDALAVNLIPELKKLFPEIQFTEFDPTENLHREKNPIILDVVEGLKEPRIISLQELKTNKIYSMHDCDLAYNLMLLKKLNLAKNVTIIGIPTKGNKKEIIRKLSKLISSVSSRSV